MTALVVTRYGGVRVGDDVVDPLVTSDVVAINRGRNELDAQDEHVDLVEIEAKFRGGVAPGKLIEVFDSFQGVSWKGKVQSVSHRADGGTLITRLTVARVTP
jgi:hypothetical protein